MTRSWSHDSQLELQFVKQDMKDLWSLKDSTSIQEPFFFPGHNINTYTNFQKTLPQLLRPRNHMQPRVEIATTCGLGG